MTTSNITASSTKAEILEASQELIDSLDTQLETEKKLSVERMEERQAVTYLLIATSIYTLLF
jgi:DNA-binding protein H-NS